MCILPRDIKTRLCLDGIRKKKRRNTSFYSFQQLFYRNMTVLFQLCRVAVFQHSCWTNGLTDYWGSKAPTNRQHQLCDVQFPSRQGQQVRLVTVATIYIEHTQTCTADNKKKEKEHRLDLVLKIWGCVFVVKYCWIKNTIITFSWSGIFLFKYTPSLL